MIREYSTLDDLKRLLRSAGPRESRIRFSEAYKDLKGNSSNAGTIALSGVTFDNGYFGHETFSFTFTDTTSFDVVGDVSGNLGSGTTTAQFTASEKFDVPIANWSGAASVDDIYYITSNSDISDDDADGFLQDARKFINAELVRIYGSLDNISFLEDMSEEIPQAVSYACLRYAGYEVFNSVSAGVSLDETSPVQNWKDMADEAMEKFCSGKGDGPRWRAREQLITELGVEGVGEGEIDIKNIQTTTNYDFER